MALDPQASNGCLSVTSACAEAKAAWGHRPAVEPPRGGGARRHGRCAAAREGGVQAVWVNLGGLGLRVPHGVWDWSPRSGLQRCSQTVSPSGLGGRGGSGMCIGEGVAERVRLRGRISPRSTNGRLVWIAPSGFVQDSRRAHRGASAGRGRAGGVRNARAVGTRFCSWFLRWALRHRGGSRARSRPRRLSLPNLAARVSLLGRVRWCSAPVCVLVIVWVEDP